MKVKNVFSLSLVLLLTSCVHIDFNWQSSNENDSSESSSQVEVDASSLNSKLIKILKENWYSEIYYPDISIDEAIIAQFTSSIDNRYVEAQQDPYTYLIQNGVSSSTTYNGKMGITITNTFNYPVVTKIEEGYPADGVLELNDIIVALGKYNVNTKSFNYHYITDANYNFSTLTSSVAGNVDEIIGVKYYREDETGKLVFHEDQITLGPAPTTQISYVVNNGVYDTLTVKMTGFEDATYTQLHQILKENELSKDKKHNIIFDLQDNGGGSLNSLVNICDLFLEGGKVVTYLQDKDGKLSKKSTGNSIEEYSFDNYIILVNENTASASEVFIKCMQYYFKDNCKLVGNTTYGKGIATNTVAIDNTYAYYLQYTCAKWLDPNQDWIGMYIGIEPDTYVEYSTGLETMKYYSRYFDFNNDILKDSVSLSNQILATILNATYNYNMRTDGYFDDDYENYIKDYQTLKGIDVTGKFDESTMIYVVKDFIDEKEYLQDIHLLEAEQWINLN